MAIQGPDLSKYDPNSAAGEYPFVILNLEDPSMAVKADIARDTGAVVMLYSWLYHGRGVECVERAYAAEELLKLDDIHIVHHWLDYEDGVTPSDLDAAKTRIRQGYAHVGTYGYLAMIGQQGADFWDSYLPPLWMAYYPAGYATVDYQDHFSATARRSGAVMHQWTSVAPPDGRDMNAVLDETWYASLGPAVYAPPPVPEGPGGGDNMLFVTDKAGKTAVFIRSGVNLWVRGAVAGGWGPPALLSALCSPDNFALEAREGPYGTFVYAVADDGALIQAAPGPFGPVATRI